MLNLLIKKILKAHKLKSHENIIVGITGYVASGKSRIASQLCEKLKISLINVIYLPFDYWINGDSLNSNTYAKRFYLKDFANALKSIKNNNFWMCPRYDLIKQKWFEKKLSEIQFESSKKFWQGRYFKKIKTCQQISDTQFGSGIYIDMDSKQPYTLVKPTSRTLYLIDGTLIAQNMIKHYYDLIIFVDCSWVNRVAGMIRRFNRKEVFSQTTLNLEEYTSFLIEEAKKYADKEIWDQKDKNMFLIKHFPDTISNFLDLYYLRQQIIKMPNLTKKYYISKKEINQVISQAEKNFLSLKKTELLSTLKDELLHLTESKHLLDINNIDRIFQNLNQILKM